MTTLARPPSLPITKSSVVAAVECALAQSGSCDMSMRVDFGAVPSNFTVPFTDDGASAGAQPDKTHTEMTNSAKGPIAKNTDFNFMEDLLSAYIGHLKGQQR